MPHIEEILKTQGYNAIRPVFESSAFDSATRKGRLFAEIFKI